jgi:hypothetical protein
LLSGHVAASSSTQAHPPHIRRHTTFNLLRDLSVKLNTINRDQKASSREFNSVRSTLRSLQGLKL